MDLIKIGEVFYNTARIAKVEIIPGQEARPGGPPSESLIAFRLHFLDADPGVVDLQLEESRYFLDLMDRAEKGSIRVLHLAAEPGDDGVEEYNGRSDPA